MYSFGEILELQLLYVTSSYPLALKSKNPCVYTIRYTSINMAIYLVLASVPLVWLCFTAYCLFRNHQRALELNVPIVYALISSYNPIWIVFQTAFPFIFNIIPFNAIPFLRYSRLGWEFHDRSKTFERLGDAWVLVTPDKIWLYVAQADAAYEIFSRGRDFGRAVWMLGN